MNQYNRNHTQYYKDKFPYYYEYVSRIDIEDVANTLKHILTETILILDNDNKKKIYYIYPWHKFKIIIDFLFLFTILFIERGMTEKLIQFFSVNNKVLAIFINSGCLLLFLALSLSLYSLYSFILKRSQFLQKIYKQFFNKYRQASYLYYPSLFTKDVIEHNVFQSFINQHKEHILSLESPLLQQDIVSIYEALIKDKRIEIYDETYFYNYNTLIHNFFYVGDKNYELIFFLLLEFETHINYILTINKE